MQALASSAFPRIGLYRGARPGARTSQTKTMSRLRLMVKTAFRMAECQTAECGLKRKTQYLKWEGRCFLHAVSLSRD